MNFNQSWSSNRGRSRGNRGCGRGRRGGANMHYRGGPGFHRAVPPLLNAPEAYYNLPRFRATQESFGHLYCHPLNQEPSWPLIRNRPPFTLNPRQAYLPATRVQPQISSPSTSPLPGTEEYMQRNICEKSAFLKRELELEGSCLNNALNNFDLSDGDYQSDNTNNNFCNNTYQKNEGEEYNKSAQPNERVSSPRRNKKQRQSSERIMSVEEIHEKIINHISNLSHGKKINLVNLPGPSGYDIAIQEITRQKRMELSKALRDICNDKFKETEDSSQVINSIIPDFDIKIEELPRALVEQLSSTLNENVTERIHNMCIDPELMFQQAAEILNNSLDLEKNVGENDIDKVDFNYPNFSNVDEHGRMDLELQNIENSSLSMVIDESMGQANMLSFENTENCPSTQMNFDTTQSMNFNMTAPLNYLDTQSCSSSFDMEFSQNTTVNTNELEDSALFINKSNPGMNIYTPGHTSTNSSFRGISEHPNLDNVNPAFELNIMGIPEPDDMLLPTSHDEANVTRSVASDIMSEEAELTACLAQTNPDLNLCNIDTKDKICPKTTKDNAENNDFSDIIDAADESLLRMNDPQERQRFKDGHDNEIDALLKTSASNSRNSNLDNSQIEDPVTVTFENALQLEDQNKVKTEEKCDVPSLERSRSNTNSPSRSKDRSELTDVKPADESKEKANTENVAKLKLDLDIVSKKKEKKSKSKPKDNESQRKCFEDEQQEKRQTDKKSKIKYVEDEISKKSTEKDEFHDRSDRKQHWDKYSLGECSKEYTNDDDLSEKRRQDRRQEDKKFKGKYDEDYYKSDKYDRSKCDVYSESYDESYRKKYGGIDDDKHRRPDLYHYSKYSADVDDGRNSKRYYQDKISSYPHRQDYAYHKYEYPLPSDYYQRQDYSYPSEEYDQKTHHSKSHKSKYKKHSKKHKRHNRDHSSGSNASSSGSEKNSSTSVNYKTKYPSKPSDMCDSPEEGSTSRHLKTSLKERIQVLCDTKMLNFNPELVSPKVIEDSEQTSNVDDLHNGTLINDKTENVEDTLSQGEIKMETSPPYEEPKPLFEDMQHISKEISDEEDLKGSNEIEALECKKYSQRPWKSPGEKKFMMEHLNQNAVPEEEDCKTDILLNTEQHDQDKIEILACDLEDTLIKVENKEIITDFCEPQQDANYSMSFDQTEPTTPNESDKKEIDEFNQTTSQEVNILNSAEVSSTSENAGLKLELKLNEEFPVTTEEKVSIETCDVPNKDATKILATTYTQTDSEKDHSPKKSKKDSGKDKNRETYKEKIKPKQNSFTQTVFTSTTTSTQTHKLIDLLKNKLTQTDVSVDSAKELEKVETLEHIPKSQRRKRCIERMFDIDKEIDKLIKERQTFYNLLNYDSDVEKEVEVPIPTVPELDEAKQKPANKEKTKNSRETKTAEKSAETKKQTQNNSKSNVTKQSQPSKTESGKKSAEVASDSNDKEHIVVSTQEVYKTKSKLKRGRPKRNQDPIGTELQKGDNPTGELNKKVHVKEETVKDAKSEVTKPKSSSKDKVEASRKRKYKEKVPEEHSKPAKVEMAPSKRHKGESRDSIEKEIKPTLQKPIELKTVESDTSQASTKSRKKEKKQENEKKMDTVDDVDKVIEIRAIEKVDECLNVTAPEEDMKESKLNGSAASEPILLPPIEELPIIVEPKAPEVSSSVKKKKRRLSGILDYRKKKKKSKNKNKKIVPPINREIFSVKSAVNVTRFSLTQLEEMRNEIRSKRAIESEPIETKEDLSRINYDVDYTNVLDSSTAGNEVENVATCKVEVAEEREALIESESQDDTTEFKNFNGAILVIKVIENTVLAASDKGQLLYFDMNNGELFKTIDISEIAVTSLVVTKTNEDNFIYAGSLDSCLSIIDFNSKSIIKQEKLSEPIQCMEYSWRFIFVGSDRGSITRFDLNLDKVADSLKVSNSNILTIKAFQEGPRKVLIVAMRNSPVCVRDAISGLLLRTMQTSFLPTVYTLLIDKNLIYCGTSQHDILVYTFERRCINLPFSVVILAPFRMPDEDRTQAPETSPLYRMDGKLVFQHEATKSKGVVCMQIVGNLLLAGCYNGNIYIYNINNNAYLGTMNGPGGLMLSMEIVKDKIIVGTKSSNFKAWNIPQQFVDQM